MKRNLLASFVAGLIICSVCACGKKEEPIAEVETPVVEEVEKSVEVAEVEEPEDNTGEEDQEVEEEESGEEKDLAYVQLYLDKIDEVYSSGMADQFALVDVDGNETPELAASDSKESWDHDNAFLYTVYDNNIVLLKSNLIGQDGHHIFYSEGKNLIETGGAMGGFISSEYEEIDHGGLTGVFSSFEHPEGFSENGDHKYVYEINNEKVSETEYHKQIADFVLPYNPFISIDCDGLNEVEYSYENGYVSFKITDTKPYLSFNEIKEELKKLQVNNNSEDGSDTEPWKVVYKNCLYDIISGKEYLSDSMDAFTYNDIGRAYFSLLDITEDGVPELLVSVNNDNPYWTIYTTNGDNYENIGNMSFYDAESKKIYEAGKSTFEEYYIYVFKDGKLVLDSLIGEADADVPYFKQDAQGNQSGVSAADMDAFRNGFKAGLEKYGIKGMELTKENIDKELGTNVETFQ